MRALLLCCGLLFSAAVTGAADWPRFRGPAGSGTVEDDKVPSEWSDKKNVKWKLALPGKGFSSPIVVGDAVFVTCFSGGTGDLANLKRFLVCVDRQEGQTRWSREVKAELPEFRSKGGFGAHGYATPTPASDGERVYALFGTTGLLAFDLKGNKLWQKGVGRETNSTFGSSSSPIVYKDFVIVTAGSESQSLIAFHKVTGAQVWSTPATSLSSCYSTPVIVKDKQGEDELLVSVANEMWGLNPTTGKLKWYAATDVDNAACTSLVAEDGIAYAVGGRSGGRTAVTIGGKGDISKANVLWSKRGGTYVPSPVLYKGHLYWFDQRGSAVCANAKTGEEVGRQRLGGAYYASPLIIKDKIYAVSRYDGTYVLEASPKLTKIAQNKLGDDSDFSGSPAVSDGQLFLRSDKYLYCIEAK